MQINRLFEMVYILLEKETVTAKEFAERFEVSVRTIYRDVESLSAAGIPIYALKGRGGGICLMDHFVLNKSALSETERDEILWALQGVNALKATDSNATLSKIGSLFGEPGTKEMNWIRVDFSNWKDDDSNAFQSIKESVTQKRVLEIDYYNSNGLKTHRKIEPLQIWFKDRFWYLKAYCRSSSGMRLFKITRIQNLQLLDEHFDRQAMPEGSNNQESRGEECMVCVKLQIDASQGFRIYDEYLPDMIQRQEDGSYLATLICPENDWVYNYILSYGPMARVLEPTRIKNIVIEKMEQTLKLYSKYDK